MNLPRNLVYMLITLLPGTKAVANDISQPFTIKISTEQQTVSIGHEVRIHVTLTNTSGQIIWLERSPNKSQAEIHYAVHVKANGEMGASETKYGSAVRTHQTSGSEILMPVEPGKTMEEDTVLGKQFDMSAPGDYTVQLSRPASDNPKDGVIESNKITITITP